MLQPDNKAVKASKEMSGLKKYGKRTYNFGSKNFTCLLFFD